MCNISSCKIQVLECCLVDSLWILSSLNYYNCLSFKKEMFWLPYVKTFCMFKRKCWFARINLKFQFEVFCNRNVYKYIYLQRSTFKFLLWQIICKAYNVESSWNRCFSAFSSDAFWINSHFLIEMYCVKNTLRIKKTKLILFRMNILACMFLCCQFGRS